MGKLRQAEVSKMKNIHLVSVEERRETWDCCGGVWQA
jgi:hypothetical protein